MGITYMRKAKLYADDMFVMNWLNEHNIKGTLLQRRGAISVYRLRKTGMTTHFECEIHYKKVDVLQYLEHLDKALTERAEQEENAKNCYLILNRIQRLIGCEDILSGMFMDYLDVLEYCNDVDVTDEVLKLRDEYHRLYPKQAQSYTDGNNCFYEQWGDEDNPFDYWADFMIDERWRLDTVKYIPIYNED